MHKDARKHLKRKRKRKKRKKRAIRRTGEAEDKYFSINSVSLPRVADAPTKVRLVHRLNQRLNPNRLDSKIRFSGDGRSKGGFGSGGGVGGGGGGGGLNGVRRRMFYLVLR